MRRPDPLAGQPLPDGWTVSSSTINGKVFKRQQLLADDAGVALLSGLLPRDPIRLPDGTALSGKMEYLPYSIVRWVLLAIGVPMEDAMILASRSCMQIKYGGLPVIGYVKPEALSQLQLPEGIGALVATDAARAEAEENLWGVDVKVLDASEREILG